MRALALSLVAVVPLMTDETPRSPPIAPCALAIELHVRAPLTVGVLEWHVITGEADRLWKRYGVTFCWTTSMSGCDRLEVRLRVFVAEEARPPVDASASGTVLGWIAFSGSTPGTEITLSIAAARAIVGRSHVGDRALIAWPPAVRDRYVPRVLGRALAHEIGHYVLGSREHTRTGLMAASFDPDRITLEGASRFTLSPASAGSVRAHCAQGSERRASTSMESPSLQP
jgi:hypothetical protein